MHRTFVTMIALCALLTQALVGVGTGAVLCIKGGTGPCGVDVAVNACSCCCAQKAAPVQTVIQLCTPCHDECNDCIEVDLPDETLLAMASSLELPVATFLAMAWLTEDVLSAPMAGVAATGFGAGPPMSLPPPNALIVKSTILLL